MPTFTYEGRDQQGNRIAGTVEATEERAAVKQLHDSGYFVTGVRQQDSVARPAQSTAPGAAPTGVGAPFGVNARDLSIFFRDVYQMLHAGIALAKAFDLLGDNSSNLTLRRLAKSFAPALGRGEKLSDQLRKHPTVFSPLVIGMVTAGEEGGFLDRVCLQISQFLERDYEMQQRLKRETLYPKMVIGLALVVGAIVTAAPTLSTGGNFGVAFLQGLIGSLLGFALPIGVIVAVWLALKFRIGGAAVQKLIADIKLKIPWVGTVVRKIALARFCRALASLYSAGMGFGRSLQLAADACGNEAISSFVYSRIPEVERGGRLSELVRGSDYFPPMVVNMLTVGEETGDIDGSLNKVAEYYEMESETSMRAMTRVAGVGALGLVTVYVGMMAVRFYTGYFDKLLNLPLE